MSELLDSIQNIYTNSEVVSGEFIESLTFPKHIPYSEVKEAVQEFLDWDESDAEFTIVNGPTEQDIWIVIT